MPAGERREANHTKEFTQPSEATQRLL